MDIGPFDPAPAKGAFKKVPARFFSTFEDSYQYLLQYHYKIVVLDSGCDDLLPQYELPKKCAFILGHEEWGHSFKMVDYPGIGCVSIPQYGQVQSLNVAVAASIAMYEYVSQFENYDNLRVEQKS